MNIERLVSDVLRSRLQERGDREVAGGMKFRASKLGTCLRAQMLAALGAKPLKEFDDRTLRVFEVGHQTGRTFTALLSEAGVLVAEEIPFVYPEWSLACHGDYILGDADELLGVELKSAHSKSFWWAKKEKGTVAKDHQFVQAAACLLLARATGYQHEGRTLSGWDVVTMSKDDMTMAQEPVGAKHLREAERRIVALNECLTKGTLPPCDCQEAWGGKYQQYCEFFDGSGCCGEELVA